MITDLSAKDAKRLSSQKVLSKLTQRQLIGQWINLKIQAEVLQGGRSLTLSQQGPITAELVDECNKSSFSRLADVRFDLGELGYKVKPIEPGFAFPWYISW